MKAFCSVSVFVFSAFSTFVAAQAPEPPASIVIEYRDPATNRLIPSLGGLKTGQEVFATVKARDRFGNAIKCTPKITAIQGVSGDQLIVDKLNDTTHRVTGGQGFGSAELQASCEEFPTHFSKEFVAVSRDLRPAAQPQAAQAPAQGPAPAAKGGGGAGTALAVGAVAAGVGLAAIIAVAAAAGTEGDSCPAFSDCCSGGGGGGCGVPADCGCPSGTTDQGICNSSGCGAFIGIGNRSCTCN